MQNQAKSVNLIDLFNQGLFTIGMRVDKFSDVDTIIGAEMKRIAITVISILFNFSPILTHAEDYPQPLPAVIKNIMNQPRYTTANWSIYVNDLTANKVAYRFNTTKLFIPASVCKLFSVQALLHTYGYDYTFQTPVYALGKVDNGTLNGDLILVAKGDLTLGGRHTANNQIAYTNLDHVDANSVPGAMLTKQDPLAGIQSLAKQIHQAGIHAINGNVLIDTRLFETIAKRENILSPIFINDNLIDVEVQPTQPGKLATLNWRPQISTIKMINKVTTVAAGEKSNLDITANDAGNEITVTGTMATDKKNMLNTFTIANPALFAKNALIDALKKEGVSVTGIANKSDTLPDPKMYLQLKPIATLTSEPMVEYAKLILKVSHNVGANLIPLLLASHHGEKSYVDGMKELGQFLTETVHINPAEISFGDAAGGNDNYATPETIMTLLTYIYKLPSDQFEKNIYTLPILGTDGTLASIAQNTPAKGNVFAKTGTGAIANLLQDNLFLTAKSLAGFMHLKNNHWVAFVIVANNLPIKNIDDVFGIDNDVGMIASTLYEKLNQ